MRLILIVLLGSCLFCGFKLILRLGALSPSINVGETISSPDDERKAFAMQAINTTINLEDLPYLPMIKHDCLVDFVDPDAAFCDAMLEADIAVIQQLLEHQFSCSAKNVVKIKQTKSGKCVTIRARYLIPFVHPDFYYMPTTRANASQTVCTNDMSIASQTTTMTVQPITPSFDKSWRSFYDQLRYCDYVLTADQDLLQAARSVGVPIITTMQDPLPDRPIYFRYRETRLNYTLANIIAKDLPLGLFQARQIDKPGNLIVNHNKTLVIMLGNLRGGEKTWDTMYRNLLDLNNADLALMIGKQPNKNTSSLFDRAQYVWEFSEYDDWGDAIDEMMNSSEWRQTVLPQVSTRHGLFGGVQGYWSSTAISFMARYWLSQKLVEEGLVEKYERFVLTRSDHFYKCKHDLSVLNPSYIWVPTGEDYGGITDRHIVCHRTHILPAIDLYYHFLVKPEKYFRENRTMKENAEGMIRLRWIEKNLYPHHVRRFPRVMYTAATAQDKSRWSVTYSWTKFNEDGLKTKYPSEYSFASCFCSGGNVRVKKPKKKGELLFDAERQYECG